MTSSTTPLVMFRETTEKASIIQDFDLVLHRLRVEHAMPIVEYKTVGSRQGT